MPRKEIPTSFESGAGKKKTTLLEEHYSPLDLAKSWGFSDTFIRRLFSGEEGVMMIARPEKMHKRGYITMRIPASVAERVYARLQKKPRHPTSIALEPQAEVRSA